MTTYSFSTTMVVFDDDGDVIDGEAVEFSIFTTDATTGFTYSVEFTDGIFTEISIEDDPGRQALVIDGVVDPAIYQSQSGIQTLTHSGGLTSTILLIDEFPTGSGGLATIPILLEGAPLPVLDDAAAVAAFLATVTGESDALPSGFPAGTVIPFASLPGVTITENDNVTGTSGDDKFVGGKGNDTLAGSGGKDTLDGDGGKDVLKGQNGKDVLNGGGKNDVLKGGKGNDKLTGGKGNDDLTGGAGKDDFIFANTNHGTDTITDFEDGLDEIKLTKLGIGFDDLTIKKHDGGVSTKIIYEDLKIILDDVAKSDIDAGDFIF